MRLNLHDVKHNVSTDDQGNDQKIYNYQCEFFNIPSCSIGAPDHTFTCQQCDRTYKLPYTIEDSSDEDKAFEEATLLILPDVAYMPAEDEQGLVECLTHDWECDCCVELW